jgi:hypothetical protein
LRNSGCETALEMDNCAIMLTLTSNFPIAGVRR